MKAKAWLSAVRLRTLPLSVSGILVGSGMASIYGQLDNYIFILALFSTLGLQIISNLANDYGDGIKGTDNEERIGPKRAMQSGSLSAKELKTGILISVIITFIFIGLLLYVAFKGYPEYFLLFLVLAALAVWAAIRYTVGDSAYGYKGLGDLFVFCFFGLLSVLGSLFLFTKELGWVDLLPAIAIGTLSTAVLNLNNLRDYSSDSRVGKNTLVVKLGVSRAKLYHFFLLLISLLCMLLYLRAAEAAAYQYLCLIVFIPLGLHAVKVKRINSAADFDPELKKVALSTFFMALMFYLGFNIFL
ncbi:MAG: 1,4-dihydroxy-2-naphthoate octaprenyltransferase [Flavobacteriaceae bacterium]|nr:1,4-dihydroxy-2-naphthoate octaprenyltransferase [Muriicola sp.]MBT8291446.1 1,4-dihydroxy-2-naphthoate octaprenyltransferase [Muriicola sp.]NNK36648.1 1,4-dihydroxy-2-naphthoate octaprenyltransferase [Eudoraea sp.]NNL40623.1 1,4-dihydroxy-2-naphthoate octaprenyltransferase [Flavobacteriaceae bacterium]